MLLAIDRSSAMIENVWPGNPLVHAKALCGEWTHMPIADQACDVVVGDGCFTVIRYPQEYEGVIRELRRVLKGDGLLAMRIFVRPDMPEPVGELFDDLWAGRIVNFHTFKWRLAMALHGDLAGGVRLADIWNAWNAAVPEPDVLAKRLDWPIETIHTIDVYRERDVRYTFPRLEELRRALSDHFTEVACVYPDYQMGDRCPTVGLKPR